jgi:hypothetical protein
MELNSITQDRSKGQKALKVRMAHRGLSDRKVLLGQKGHRVIPDLKDHWDHRALKGQRGHKDHRVFKVYPVPMHRLMYMY